MTHQPFLALITPIGSGGGGGPPGYPTHPWVPPYGPSHPIVPPGGYPPLGIWGGGGVGPYPDAGFPGPQPGGPVYPSQPIYRPDLGIWGGPWFPPVIWDPSRPTNPIVNPGDPNNPGAGQPQPPRVEWKAAWSPSTGWVVVGIPTGEHVTPSEQQSESEF